MNLKKLMVSLLLFLPFSSFCDELVGVTIERILIRADRNDALVRFSQSFNMACEDRGYWAKLNASDAPERQLLWSAIMMAYATKSKVTVATNTECSFHNVIAAITFE